MLSATALAGLLAIFVARSASLGAWVVDDAGVSIAYALNLTAGHGLVSQPGVSAVEGFSNPLWVLVLAGLAAVGAFRSGLVLGLPVYVITIKGLAVVLHAVVLVAMASVTRQLLTVAAFPSRPSRWITLCLWGAAGTLLAMNPSYVIWMVSGLENPLLAAEVSVIASVAVRAVLHPTRRALGAIGLLAGLAAITRPDGIVYVVVPITVSILAVGTSMRRWRSLLLPGLAAFAAVFLGYVCVRRAYFQAWLPNTAVAKNQALPSVTDVTRLVEVGRAFGWPLVGVAFVGAVVALAAMYRNHNPNGLRVVGMCCVVLGATLIAFIVLRPDWMAEFRFLTPAWPILSVATVLGGAQLVVSARSGLSETVVAIAIVAVVLSVMPSWRRRTDAFRASPTIALCHVAERYGLHFDVAAQLLHLTPESTSLLLPDVGGTLLVSDLHIIDLAGLTDRRIAELLRAGDATALADYVLDDLRPTFIHIHDYWSVVSGLGGNTQLGRDYLELDPGDWVRRDAVAPSQGVVVAEVSGTLQHQLAQMQEHSRRASCERLLFS